MLSFLLIAEITVEDGSKLFLENAGNHLHDYMASQP
jgi:hypothetical protein